MESEKKHYKQNRWKDWNTSPFKYEHNKTFPLMPRVFRVFMGWIYNQLFVVIYCTKYSYILFNYSSFSSSSSSK